MSEGNAVKYRPLYLSSWDGLRVCRGVWFDTAAAAEHYLLTAYSFACGGRIQRFRNDKLEDGYNVEAV